VTTKRGQTQEDTHADHCAADVFQPTLKDISSKSSVYIEVGYKNQDAENKGALAATEHITLEGPDDTNQAGAHEGYSLEESSEQAVDKYILDLSEVKHYPGKYRLVDGALDVGVEYALNLVLNQMFKSCLQVASIGNKAQSKVQEREFALNKVERYSEVQHYAEREVTNHGHPCQDSGVAECHHRHQRSVDFHRCVKNGLESVGSMRQIGDSHRVKSLSYGQSLSARICLLIEHILSDLKKFRNFLCLVQPLL
jgi:hypothetical protein